MKFEKYDDTTEQFHVSMSAHEIAAIYDVLGIAWNSETEPDWGKLHQLKSIEDLQNIMHTWERHAWHPTHAYPEPPDSEP